jgi:hypothetical protein
MGLISLKSAVTNGYFLDKEQTGYVHSCEGVTIDGA